MLIATKTLGCKVNQYETEMLKERFQKNGHEIVQENDFADVYIINTCTVTSLADRKSRQYIRKMKKINPNSVIAVTGCYAQISPEEVAAIEAVDIVVGTNKKGELPDLIEEYVSKKMVSDNKLDTIDGAKTVEHILDVDAYEELNEYIETGIVTSMESRTRAYIKVQEGCNRFCSYCVIPYARGKVRSRQVEYIVEEAKSLVKQGFKEIVLTGINTALYGTEPEFEYEDYNKNARGSDGKEKLEGIEIIINELEQLEGDFRIRLSSLEPTVINAEYVEKLTKYKKLCPHLHLSIQSGSDNVLKLMNRRYDRQEYIDIVNVLKSFDIGYGITTDIIAGFPGESEEDFRDSLDMVERVGFCKVHAFKYSKRPGTKAAEMKGHVAPEIKNRRSSELIKAGDKASVQFREACKDQKRRMLIEEFDTDTKMFNGYTENYIRAYLPLEKYLQIAKFDINENADIELYCEKRIENLEEIDNLIENAINTFVDVHLIDLYRDGMTCSV